MDKQKIKKHIITRELEKIGRTDLNYSDYLCGTGRACDQVLDIGDASQENARNEISIKLASQAQIIEKTIKTIKQLSFKNTSVIELGAIVETNHVYLIIATSISPFEYDDKQFVGVSMLAPLYKCLDGKSVGEECVYNGTKFTIKNIY